MNGESYEVVADGATAVATDLAQVMKIALARNFQHNTVDLSRQLNANGANVLTTTSAAKPVPFNATVQIPFRAIPTGVTVKPLIKAHYFVVITMPLRDNVTRDQAYYMCQFVRPVAQPLNVFLDYATVDFGTGMTYTTQGSQSYFVNQLLKSEEERKCWSSKLDGNCDFHPFPTQFYEGNGGPIIEGGDTVPFNWASNCDMEIKEPIAGQPRRLVLTYEFFDVLAIEPFISSYLADTTAGLVGLSQIGIKCVFTSQPFHKIVKWRKPYFIDTAAGPFQMDLVSAHIDAVNVSLDYIEYQTSIAPLVRGISNQQYQRLETVTFPFGLSNAMIKKRFNITTTSIPQLFVIRKRIDDSVHQTKFVNSFFDGSVGRFSQLTVRLSDYGQHTVVLDHGKLRECWLKKTCEGAHFYYGITSTGLKSSYAPIIVFDPIIDMPGTPRAAGMSSTLTWDFEVICEGSLCNEVPVHANLEVIAVHFNPVGTKATQFEPAMTCFTMSEVNAVYEGVYNGSIKVSPNYVN